MSRPEAIVVGGGIVGAACAAELVDAGVRVLLLEGAPRLAGGATAAGMGHIIILDDSEVEFELTHVSQQLWAELAPRLPAAAQVDPCGVLWLAPGGDELAAAAEKAAFMRAHDLPAELLSARELHEAEPRLRQGMAGGLLLPRDSVLYPPVCVRWMLEQAAATGRLSVRTATAVSQLGDGTVTTAAGERLEADWVVNAAGHHGLALLPEPLPSLTIRPRKGHLAITARAPGFIRHQLIDLSYITAAHGHDPVSVAFNLQPRTTGQMLIGSSRQYGSADATVEPRILARMLRNAVAYLPDLAVVPVVRAWTGFRAATEDKLPIIGPAPGAPRLLLATGHEGLGITTSLVTGRLIRSLVTGEPPILDPRPFSPAREVARAA